MAKKTPIPRYEVIKDTREQTGWWFDEDDECFGTTIGTLPTADYTLKGLEDVFVIERKASTSEFATNINEARFDRELERLEEFQFGFMLLDFSMKDVLAFPRNSGIPLYKQKYIKVTPERILSKIFDYQIKYKTKIILTDGLGEQVAKSLFRKMIKFAHNRIIFSAEGI